MTFQKNVSWVGGWVLHWEKRSRRNLFSFDLQKRALTEIIGQNLLHLCGPLTWHIHLMFGLALSGIHLTQGSNVLKKIPPKALAAMWPSNQLIMQQHQGQRSRFER